MVKTYDSNISIFPGTKGRDIYKSNSKELEGEYVVGPDTKSKFPSGTKLFFRKGMLHRKGAFRHLPAVILPDGTKQWWVDGLLHRKGRPAIVYWTGIGEHWENGKKIQKPTIKPQRLKGKEKESLEDKSLKTQTGEDVVINLYDVINNKVTRLLGLGVYHTGLEVYGSEWSFAYCKPDEKAVFAIQPRSVRGMRYRKSFILGKTSLSQLEVENIISEMSITWTGESYDLLERNCNHFCDELARKLCGVGLPKYVNRIARLGIAFRPSCARSQIQLGRN